MRRHVSILCHAAAHDSTQWHAVAAHLSLFAHQLLAHLSCNGNEILSGIRACCWRSVSAVANISQYQSASEFNMISPNAVCHSSSFIVDPLIFLSPQREAREAYLPFCRCCQPNAQISRNQNCPRTDVLKSRDCLENAFTLSVLELS